MPHFCNIKNLKKLAAALCAAGLFFSAGTTASADELTADERLELQRAMPVASNEIENWPTGPTVGAEAAILIEAQTGTILYEKNIHQKEYPASTTKILTCLVALEYGDLEQLITVSDYAADQTSDSSVANLKAGDVLSLQELLYGLMLRSGNDAAIAIAEGIAGSEEAFADLMNQKAAALGATHSHFVTPHGLHDDDHYTTIYDMYLIFSAALKNDVFRQIISTDTYQAIYQAADGSRQEQTWNNTNQYLSGARTAPYGFTVIGGKTGTTYEAGYCLVLYCTNDQDQEIISIVYNADCALNLYYLMNELLYTFGEAQ